MERDNLRQNPLAPATATWPPLPPGAEKIRDRGPFTPQTVGTSFTGATLTDTGAFPPDSMGTVGPTQFVVFVNGRLRTFNKTTGVADGVINADPDVFFASVMTPVGGAVVLNFTSDPQVRYDRLSGRWIMSIIDVPCTDGSCVGVAANRWLVAVSDAASAGTLSGTTVWSFFFFQTDAANFCDYPSLGVDASALYTGCNMFTPAGAFVGTNGYVIRKTSVLGAGPIFVTTFANLTDGSTPGPFAPRGVDNYDPTSNEGYFIGVSVLVFSQLDFRRVSNPGSATPTISGNLTLTIPTTTFPNPVTHLGNLGGNNGRLDSLDDRLYAAHIRNGRLWTAHNFRVSATGVANTGAAARNASRWYELNGIRSTDNGGVPVIVQAGTVFDSAATLALARQFWIPSVMVSGQGHAALGFSTAGTPFRADAATVGRLVGDTLGTTQTVANYTTSATAYNPPSDPGGAAGRRWGDYSYTSLDPNDDMTMWTIQEFCDATNSYGVRVAKLIAPPPATPSSTDQPAGVATGQASVNVVVTGTSALGSGFYDPGANLAPPALPFTHITASVTGSVTVNSVTFTDPTHVTLNISTVGAAVGAQNITITNPDGQAATGIGILTVVAGASADLSVTKTDGVTTATPGGSVTYTITASNAGPDPAAGSTVADTFPASLTCNWTCVGAGGGTCTASGSGNINDTVNLPAGGSVTYTASCTISASATGTLSNTSTVTAPGGVTDPTPGNNSATDSDTLTPSADLAITKTDGVTTATAGGSVTYTITGSNAGPSNAPGSTVADTFPASLTCTWTCVGAGGGTCTASGSGNINDSVNLPSGGSVTYTASCSISASATGTLSNTSTVAAPAGVTDPTPGNNSATDSDTLAASADLSITKTDGVTTATPGGSVTYTITSSNAGPSNAPGSTVADTFPASLTCTWTCVGAGGGTCTASGSGNINDTVSLPSGGSVTYTASCSISASATGTLSNTSTVAAPAGVTDPTPGNNSATDSDTLAPSADLAITKTDGVTTATPGGSVTYTITASNAGPSDAASSTVADTFPASLTCAWTCVGAGGGTCTAAGAGNINDTVNLPSGGSVTYTAICTISGAATGTLSNTATVAAPGGVTDPTPGNNSATDTDTLNPLFTCATPLIAVPDGRLTETAVPTGATLWLAASLRIGSSYSLEFKNTTGDNTPPGVLTVFSGDDACAAVTSSVVVTDTSTTEPGASPAAARVSFTAAGTLGLFHARLVNAGGPVTASFGWSETTLYSPAWSTNGSFDTFYSFLNTTNTALSGTLTFLDTSGVVVGTFPITVGASNQTTSTNTIALALARNRTGTAKFTHNGPPGALVLEAAIANFALSTAYVQPVKFVPQREAH